MNEKTPGTLETVDILLNRLTPEQRDALKKVLISNTVPVRDTPCVDTRLYYHIRMNQFECVVDSRDCKGDSKDELLTNTLNNKTQAWYFAGYRGDDNLETLVEEWNHSQYIDWLRR